MISGLAAVALQTWLHRRGWPNLEVPVSACLVAGVVLGARAPRVAIAAVLGLACLAAGLTDVLAQYRSTGANLFWQALIAGILVAHPAGTWALPRSWMVPLRFWALAIALSWPIVALRESNFDLAVLGDYRAIVTSIGIPPAVHVAWIASVAAVALLGILWCDLLFRVARDQPAAASAFRTCAVAPFVAGASIASAVGVYQSAIDIEFLNRTFFGALGRASGTMLDGNAFGAASALAAAAAFALAAGGGARAQRISSAAAGILCCAGAWASASRTALLIVVAAGTGVAVAGCVSRSVRTRRLTLWSAGALVVAASVTLTAIPVERLGGPLARLSSSLGTQAWSRTATSIARDLVERDGYGTIGHGLIREFPVSGVGVGSYHALAIDYSRRYGVDEVRPDNAQNWFRHQLAELGVIGSLGWILWIWPLAKSMKTAIAGEASRPVALILGGGFAGLVLASLFGMPTQNAAVFFAFWMIAAWLGLLAEQNRQEADAPRAARFERLRSAILAGLLLLFIGSTAWTARTTLRVPARAAQTKWSYEHGVQRPSEVSAAGRWTSRRAVITFEPRGRYLALRFEVRHPDASARPVEVTVKMSGKVLLHTRVRTPGVFEGRLEMPDDAEYPVLELTVDRAFIDPLTGVERGLLLHPFEFVDESSGEMWRFR